MAETDGTLENKPDPNARKTYRKQRAYDHIWHALEGTGIRMMGDHSMKGGIYRLLDYNGVKIGELSFDKQDGFLGGTFYGKPVVSGRALSKHDAMYKFIALIEETHVRK